MNENRAASSRIIANSISALSSAFIINRSSFVPERHQRIDFRVVRSRLSAKEHSTLANPLKQVVQETAVRKRSSLEEDGS